MLYLASFLFGMCLLAAIWLVRGVIWLFAMLVALALIVVSLVERSVKARRA